MIRRPAAAALVAALAVVAGCGGDDGGGGDEATTATTAETSTTATTAGATSSTTTAPASTTTTVADAGDPLDAAEAFLLAAFPDASPVLGEFQQGDAQSGEVVVSRRTEGGGTDLVASTLLLRLVDGEWQVLAAVNPNVTIETPENGAEVDRGPLVVSGAGRGFEATLDVRAVGLGGELVAEAVAAGGALETPEPYEATLELSAVPPGEELYVVVAGGTGLDGDTGEFSAVRVTT